MKNNFMDDVVGEVSKRVGWAQQELGSRFKNTKPFAKEPVDKSETYFHYKQLTVDDMLYLVQTHGQDVVEEFIYEMSQVEKDKRRKLQ